MQTVLNDQLVELLNQVATKMDNTTPLARSLADVLMSETQQNFESEGRPAWDGLSLHTIKRYLQKGLETQGLLRRRTEAGGLYDSLQSAYSADSASVTTNAIHAATHQFGAKKGEYGKTKFGVPIPWGDIPARRFIPITDTGDLQPETSDAVEDVLFAFIDRAFD